MWSPPWRAFRGTRRTCHGRRWPSGPGWPGHRGSHGRTTRGCGCACSTSLRGVALAAELQLRLDQITEQGAQLRASRQRIATAQVAERRRLERDIHDGAQQQQLIALAVHLRAALGATDPAAGAAAVRRCLDELCWCIDGLRELARGASWAPRTDDPRRGPAGRIWPNAPGRSGGPARSTSCSSGCTPSSSAARKCWCSPRSGTPSTRCRRGRCGGHAGGRQPRQPLAPCEGRRSGLPSPATCRCRCSPSPQARAATSSSATI